MQDRFNFRYFYNGKIYDVFAVDFMNKTAQLVSLDRKETLLKGIDTDKLIQCTGLKDKNCKLIYEGDILQQPQLPHKVVCEWFKDGYWLNGFMNGAKRELRNMHDWYEVIGNIYKNKELLTGVEN